MSKPLTALFVDCDSYFASVEQHLDPALRGRAVGVAPVMAESSCCIAASYEAKAFGVKTGTRISDARVLCPGIAIVESKHSEYVRYHHQVIAAVEDCIASDGWVARTSRILETDKKGKTKDKGWTCDLVPKPLIVARYFAQEQDDIDAATADLEATTATLTPKRGAAKGVVGRVAEVVEKLPSTLVRKSDPGVVIRADGRVEIMRWGFHRSFNPSINNARSDKLESGMWKEPFAERRCVIPISLFYEWGPGGGGHKQAYEFRDPGDDYLWVAGVWEDGKGEVGPCYSMVTTSSSPLMSPIHDRMPALLRSEEMQEFLTGHGHWNFQPFAGTLVATPCESPLARPKGGNSQQELF